MPEAKKRVVIVEDDYLIADFLAQLCGDFGMEVVGKAFNAAEAMKVIEETTPDYILMDVRLQGKRDGVDIANAVHAKRPNVKIIFITGSNEPPTLDRIQEDDPYKILIKPIDPEELRAAFE